jgi:tetratricopeptide (TPR) repeat protein
MTITEKTLTRKGLMGAISFVIIMAIVIGVSFTLPGKDTTPVLVNFPISWSVAMDTLKLSPIFGIGTANYLTAFDKFIPVTYNQSPLWNARFSTGRSFLLTLLTETGLFGILAFVIVIFFIIKETVKSAKHVFKDFELKEVSMLSLLLLTASFFIYPASTPLITLFFILISLVFINNEVTLNLSATSAKSNGVFVSHVPAILIAVVILAAQGFLVFFSYKYLKAEYVYKIAVASLANNDGKTTYDALKAAINTNPYVDRYHSTYAQVNLALAGSLAQKKDLTDQDRATVAQLIQQGIREAKATVTLNPQRAGNWEVLAGTYRSVVPFAQGADQFAIQSYDQAVSLDPINPNLRIALGGVYYALGRYDEAIETFKLAVLAKNDLANAHYNLSIAYRERKDFDNAIAEMQTVISLVDKNSEDYSLAIKALDELQKNKTAPKTTESTDNLSSPKQTETSNITPPITLPIDSNPPATGQ